MAFLLLLIAISRYACFIHTYSDLHIIKYPWLFFFPTFTKHKEAKAQEAETKYNHVPELMDYAAKHHHLKGYLCWQCTTSPQRANSVDSLVSPPRNTGKENRNSTSKQHLSILYISCYFTLASSFLF
jgi:hypothetical protein